MKTKEQILFEDAPVWRAVISLVIPTVISQMITVIYNMADTFFIGQIGDPNQVAAVSLCMPMFIFLTGLCQPVRHRRLQPDLPAVLGTGDRKKSRTNGGFSVSGPPLPSLCAMGSC